MYKAFDEFFSHDSWTSHNWPDEDRFFQALDKVVRDEGFSVLDLGSYIAQKYAQEYPAADPEHLRGTRDHYVALADNVKRYLEATKR